MRTAGIDVTLTAGLTCHYCNTIQPYCCTNAVAPTPVDAGDNSAWSSDSVPCAPALCHKSASLSLAKIITSNVHSSEVCRKGSMTARERCGGPWDSFCNLSEDEVLMCVGLRYCTCSRQCKMGHWCALIFFLDNFQSHHLRALLSFRRTISVPKILSQNVLLIPNPVIK